MINRVDERDKQDVLPWMSPDEENDHLCQNNI